VPVGSRREKVVFMSQRFVRGCVVGLALLAGLGAGKSDSLAELATPRKAATPPAPALTGPAYAIKLTRPVNVGDRYSFVADAMVLQSMTANVSGRERTLRPSNLSIHFEAVEQIIALNDNGEPLEATYTVSKCVKREGKAETAMVQPGRVLTVRAGRWKSRIEVDDGDLDIRDEMMLRGIVSLPNLKGVTIDDCFGTAVPQQVGGAWPVNAAALAQLVSREGVKVRKQDISGTIKLTAIKPVDGIPHLLINGKAIVKNWKPDTADLPPEAKFVKGTDEIKFTKLIPVDPSGHCLTDSYSEKVLMKLKTSDAVIGPDILVDAKLLKTVGIKRTPISADPLATGGE
jgi:hypothetical protein